jgi:hypothetical protein
MIVKQSVARKLPCLLYDVTDFKTPETGVAYTAVTVYIQKEDGAQTEKTLASGDWTERGNGAYDISFTAAELNTLGEFKYQVTDGQTEFLDFNGWVTIETGTNTDLKTDLSTIISTGGAGPWTTFGGLGPGNYNLTVNVKDQSANNVENVKITIHNAANDDSPAYGPIYTDVDGNAGIFTVEGNLYVRGSKAGFLMTPTAINVTASGTENVTGTVTVITPPIGADLSTIYISVHDISGNVLTDNVELSVTKHNDIQKDANGNFSTSDPKIMVYDSGSQTWQVELKQEAHYKITSTKVLGEDDNGNLIDREFFVGSETTTNLGTIRIG